jgi:hypothetical protein
MHRAKQRFDDAIARVRNLDTLFNHLTVTLHYASNDVDDILRSEIVYAVSAFDKLIHDLIKQGMVDTYTGIRTVTLAYKNFPINLSQFDSITNPTTLLSPIDIFEGIVIASHKHISFQDIDKISSGLSLIWSEDHKWQRIATCMGTTDRNIKAEFRNIIIRRNQIVHEGDLDLLSNTLQTIRQSDAVASVSFIEKLGNCIYNLV